MRTALHLTALCLTVTGLGCHWKDQQDEIDGLRRLVTARDDQLGRLQGQVNMIMALGGIPGPTGPQGPQGPAGMGATKTPHLIGPGSEDLGFALDLHTAYNEAAGGVVDFTSPCNLRFMATDCTGSGGLQGRGTPSWRCVGPGGHVLAGIVGSDSSWMDGSELVTDLNGTSTCRPYSGPTGGQSYTDTGVIMKAYRAAELTISLR